MEGKGSDTKEMIAEKSLWDQMVLEERRLEADKRGIRVCDVEEEASLTLALEESRVKKQLEKDGTDIAQSNRGSLPDFHLPNTNDKRTISQMGSNNCQDDADDNSYLDHLSDLKLSAQKPIVGIADESVIDDSDSVIRQELSIWQLFLPQDLSTKILGFLGDIDMCGYLPQIAKTNCFRPTEPIYKALCEHIYTAQSRKKKLIVENWASWRNMLVLRPRIRTNGFYCLRTLYSRAPSNDSFWEEKITQSVEVKFYRHMRFFDNGRMLYSLDTIEPEDMAKHLAPATETPKKIFEGSYTLIGKNVHVEVVMHYAVVHFELMILDGQDGYIGKFNTLRLVEHASVAVFRGPSAGMYWRNERVTHKLPNNTDLQFWRHWDWNSRNKERESVQ